MCVSVMIYYKKPTSGLHPPAEPSHTWSFLNDSNKDFICYVNEMTSGKHLGNQSGELVAWEANHGIGRLGLSFLPLPLTFGEGRRAEIEFTPTVDEFIDHA